MPDSITITNSFAQDIKLALDDALRSINVYETDERFDPQKAIGGIVRVRAELVNVLAQNSTCTKPICDNIQRQRGHQLLRDLDRLKRVVREDYGIKDAA
jgi:hypothetical protein